MSDNQYNRLYALVQSILSSNQSQERLIDEWGQTLLTVLSNGFNLLDTTITDFASLFDNWALDFSHWFYALFALLLILLTMHIYDTMRDR